MSGPVGTVDARPTAGDGVTHSEEATGRYRGQLHGAQLWVAQPEATRHRPAAFEHHADLPQVESDNAVATVLVGSFATASSPARRDTPLVGVDAALARIPARRRAGPGRRRGSSFRPRLRLRIELHS
jgi:redox-sensitive bicupin YhaK (pirin superfamily)